MPNLLALLGLGRDEFRHNEYALSFTFTASALYLAPVHSKSMKKEHSPSKSDLASASGLASSQETQQSQPVSLWTVHAPRLGESPSPFPRSSLAFSTRATDAGDLFLFGGFAGRGRSGSLSNDLYLISTTRDFSTTLLPTNGDVPSPRFGYCAVFIDATSTLFIWGGATNTSDSNGPPQSNDDALYMLNFGASPLSLDWIRIQVNAWPSGRFGHTMTSDDSKLFIFGGRDDKKRFNDIWALDLNRLESNPFWESYEPTAGNKKPLPRSRHVSIMTGDRMIIFGGFTGTDDLNDTWSFNISTRKWTELQCTGSIPSPRSRHAAVLIDDVMYVLGGLAVDGTFLGDLTALNLSTQQWTSFQDIGTGPCGRVGHAMGSDERRIFVFGGEISPGRGANKAKLIHVLDTKLLNFPEPEFNTVKHSEEITQAVQKLSAGPLQPKDLPSLPTSASGRPTRVREEDDDGEGSTEHHAKLVTPDAPSRKELVESEAGRLVELERRLSEMLIEKNEQGRRIAQLANELAQKSALLERTEANAAQEKKRARRELRELQAKLDESLLSRDHALEQVQCAAEANENLHANAEEEKELVGRELRELQAKLTSRDHALEQAQIALQKASRAAKANENLHANAVAEKNRAGQELRELQAKLDELLLSRDHAVEQALQKASHTAAEANERSQRELAEVYAKLEARESELAAVRLRLVDTDNGCANLKSKAKAASDCNDNESAPGPANADEDPLQVVHRLLERMQAMEAEMATMRRNEKSFEMMECRNED